MQIGSNKTRWLLKNQKIFENTSFGIKWSGRPFIFALKFGRLYLEIFFFIVIAMSMALMCFFNSFVFFACGIFFLFLYVFAFWPRDFSKNLIFTFPSSRKLGNSRNERFLEIHLKVPSVYIDVDCVAKEVCDAFDYAIRNELHGIELCSPLLRRKIYTQVAEPKILKEMKSRGANFQIYIDDKPKISFFKNYLYSKSYGKKYKWRKILIHAN